MFNDLPSKWVFTIFVFCQRNTSQYFEQHERKKFRELCPRCGNDNVSIPSHLHNKSLRRTLCAHVNWESYHCPPVWCRRRYQALSSGVRLRRALSTMHRCAQPCRNSWPQQHAATVVTRGSVIKKTCCWTYDKPAQQTLQHHSPLVLSACCGCVCVCVCVCVARACV